MRLPPRLRAALLDYLRTLSPHTRAFLRTCLNFYLNTFWPFVYTTYIFLTCIMVICTCCVFLYFFLTVPLFFLDNPEGLSFEEYFGWTPEKSKNNVPLPTFTPLELDAPKTVHHCNCKLCTCPCMCNSCQPLDSQIISRR